MPAPPAVEVSECSFSYGETRGLDGVSFSVPQGAIFGLLGPNGSGKTTLFRILSTLLAPQSGSARLFGIDVAEQPLAARRHIGIVFQSQSLDPRLSVEENLAHQGHLHGLRGAALKERTDGALGKVGLSDRRKERVSTLSGGLRRRADLAKSLLHRPRLLLLDEASAGVDPGARAAFWQHLEDLRRSEGLTVLLTTHLLDEADACDGLAILDQGKLLRQGSPAELKAEIGGEVVTLETSSTAEIAQILRDEFAVEQPAVDGNELRFEHPEAWKCAGLLTERFGARIASVKVSKPTLEEVFRHHAGHSFEMDGNTWQAAPISAS